MLTLSTLCIYGKTRVHRCVRAKSSAYFVMQVWIDWETRNSLWTNSNKKNWKKSLHAMRECCHTQTMRTWVSPSTGTPLPSRTQYLTNFLLASVRMTAWGVLSVDAKACPTKMIGRNRFYYRPQTKWRKGYVFTSACHSVHRDGVCPSACWDRPPGQTPPRQTASHTP